MSFASKNGSLVISMHMEKCGGTSLTGLLRDEYGVGFHLYDPGPAGSPELPRLPLGIRCLHGHMFFGLHEQFPNRDCQYITLLRDPVDRFLSNFEHIVNHQHPLHRIATAENGLASFCREHEARHYRNLFVRRLAGVHDEIESADLDRAEQRLRGFAVIGVLENADRFVADCANRFGWQNRHLAHSNPAPGRRHQVDRLGESEREIVLAANDWDMQLMSRIEDLLKAQD